MQKKNKSDRRISSIKRLDSNLKTMDTTGSRITQYWAHERFEKLWELVSERKGAVPLRYDFTDQNKVCEFFALKGFEYGNWLSQEDRYNYLFAFQVAAYDLGKFILGWDGIGLGHLGVSFGARGSRSALAHFEPQTNIINITRYKRSDKLTDSWGNRMYDEPTSEIKDKLFVHTGGMGSFGHEYFHFLDYLFGGGIEPSTTTAALTAGNIRYDQREITAKKGTIRYEVQKIMNILQYTDSGKYTSFYGRMVKLNTPDANGKVYLPTYWLRQNELFARTAEVYISMKLTKKKSRNLFLHKNKYDDPRIYPSLSLIKKAEPHFDRMLKLMRQHIN